MATNNDFKQKKIGLLCYQTDGGIGNNGTVLYFKEDLPGDMEDFTQRSIGTLDSDKMGNALILGYKTFLSLHIKKALPKRYMVIISHNEHPEIARYKNCVVAHSTQEALAVAEVEFRDRDTIIMGGAGIYNETLPSCDEIYATRVYGNRPSDTKIDLSVFAKFNCEILESKEHNGIKYEFLKYTRLS